METCSECILRTGDEAHLRKVGRNANFLEMPVKKEGNQHKRKC